MTKILVAEDERDIRELVMFSLKGLVILMDAMYPPLFVAPDVSLARLLLLFRREKRPMAVVRDRAGSTMAKFGFGDGVFHDGTEAGADHHRRRRGETERIWASDDDDGDRLIELHHF